MAQLEAQREDECAADEWLNLIRDYSQLEELDRPTLLRLVKRIEVGEKCIYSYCLLTLSAALSVSLTASFTPFTTLLNDDAVSPIISTPDVTASPEDAISFDALLLSC